MGRATGCPTRKNMDWRMLATVARRTTPGGSASTRLPGHRHGRRDDDLHLLLLLHLLVGSFRFAVADEFLRV